jgi:ApbE superfamily uncharacterized protein (UPF0280 family)
MKRHQIRIKETIATIIADEKYVPVAEEEIIRQRRILEEYILAYPAFRASLAPCIVEVSAPAIIRSMAEAASRMGVGPMAAVAGAIAEFALKAMIEAGATHAIVDNGGDIAMILSQPVTVGIFTGPAKIKGIGLRFDLLAEIIGVCTSSGTVGHSLSLGKADAATVIAGNVCLADAAATALCNAITDNDSELMQNAITRLMIDAIEAMIAIIDDTLAVGGNPPNIVRAHTDVGKISNACTQEG